MYLTKRFGCLLAVLAGAASCQNDDAAVSDDEWNTNVVYRETVKCYTIDMNPREFVGGYLVQTDAVDSTRSIAKLETHDWPDEYVASWNEIIYDESRNGDLWRDMPTPSHCWVLDHESRAAVYSGSAGWHSGSDAIVISKITGTLKHRRAVRQSTSSTKPSWWPAKYNLAENSPGEYGIVVPGRSALYYLSSGIEAPGGYDVWGPIPKYDGPGKLVLSSTASQGPKVAVITLDIEGIHSGLSAVMSHDGQWAIIASNTDKKFWLIDLNKAWNTLFNDMTLTEQEHQRKRDVK